MRINFRDYNSADTVINTHYLGHWDEIDSILTGMPLHLKASDQAGLQGNPIFDPVGTNEYIKTAFSRLGWRVNIPIPSKYDFLGTDVDFGKDGIIAEAQFSNYPFLLNNLLRTEIFYKSQYPLIGKPTDLLIIITKAHMFPASNSTLYYEQAEHQLSALMESKVFDVPIRLVGLFEKINATVPVMWTQYHAARYSRTTVSRTNMNCEIVSGRLAKSRCSLAVT